MNIKRVEFPLDSASIANCIYGTMPHTTTQTGILLDTCVREELSLFVRKYLDFLTSKQSWHGRTDFPIKYGSLKNYYRIDCYFTEDTITVLEINAAFVDGWGTALNLSRSAGIKIESSKLQFPKKFGYYDDVYLPELKLFADELKIRGISEPKIFENWSEYREIECGDEIYKQWYVYGKQSRLDNYVHPLMMPTFDGKSVLDDKINLAVFSKEWGGKYVNVPKHYLARNTSWDQIPESAVLKFSDKHGKEAIAARQSVLVGKPQGKAKFLKECYMSESLIAQEYIKPSQYGDMNSQLVILCIDNDPITGYVQYSDKMIINDNSVHGPLQIN